MLKIIALLALFAVSARAVDDYKPGPDAQRKPNVPEGRVEKFRFTESKVFPDTERDAWVYIPEQYDSSQPAALMVFQDGGGPVRTNGNMRATIVMDNLIHAKEMPVTVGIFVNPGMRTDATGPQASNRSFEYDSLGDNYAKFLVNELIPFVTNKYRLNISKDPEMRGICGNSSGGIAAFTVAWERPDQFRKVISHIGSFVNIRGGHAYPALIRKTERKPIRVHLQDGINDLNNLHGDWPLANQAMASALRFAGYDHKLVLGDGAHNDKHAGAIFADELRWLWRPAMPLPEPLTKDNLAGDDALVKILPPDSKWELVGEGYGFTDGACADAEGNFLFSDLPKGTLYKVGASGKAEKWFEGPKISGMKFGSDGILYAATQGGVTGTNEQKRIIAIDPATKMVTDLASQVNPNDLVVSKAGWIYFTDTGAGQVIMVNTSSKNMGRPRVAAGGINKPNGIGLTPDGKFLVVSEYGGTNVWSFAVGEDGGLTGGERYMDLRTPNTRADSGGDGMIVDATGRPFITSHVGIQYFDSQGRLGGVIAKPNEKGCVSVAFAGPKREYLYACAADKIFRRKTLTQGSP